MGIPPCLEACRLKRFRQSTLSLLLLWSGLAYGAHGDVEIQQEPIECWPIDEFLLVQSSFVPPEDIQTAKFYFRSTAHPDYYYIELTLGQSGGRAIAPKAQPDTVEVTFYTELVTHSFSAFRTEERTVPVASGTECKRRDPEAAFYAGQNPDIAVGATRLGATPLPPGFQADGIARFLSATGITGEAGAGGVSGKTIGIIAGIGGAGAGALALTGGGSSETTTTAIGGITTTNVSSSSTSTAIGGVTSTTTTVAGGGTPTSSTTTTVGGGSTTTSGGSTTTIIGSSTTTSIGTSTSTTTIGTSTTTTSIGSSTTTTSVGSSSTTTSVGSSSTTTSVGSSTTTSTTSTTTTTVAATADLSVTKSGPANVSVGQIFSYTITVDNLGPATSNGIIVTDTWTAGRAQLQFINNPSCAPVAANQFGCNLGSLASTAPPVTVVARFQATQAGSLTNTVTVLQASPTDPNSSNNTRSVSTLIAFTAGPPAELDMAYRSSIDVEPRNGSVRGQIVINGSFQGTDNSGEFVYTARVKEGLNRVETQVDAPGDASGSWRFDFSASADFVAGSLRVESGQVFSQDGTALVFVVGGGASPPRFTFEVGEARRVPFREPGPQAP